MDYIYSQLDDIDTAETYSGEESSTAKVIVNNLDRTIKVNVDGISIDLSQDTSTGKLVTKLLDREGTTLDESEIILNENLESASFNDETKVLTLTLSRGTTLSCDLSIFTQELAEHTSNKENPHEVTKEQVGLGDVVNTGDSDTPAEGGVEKFTTGGAFNLKEALSEDIGEVASDLSTHEADKTNPHEVTKAQVGLGNVDNTSDADKPVSTAQQEALDLKADKVGPLPEFLVNTTDNVVDFIENNGVNGKPLILHLNVEVSGRAYYYQGILINAPSRLSFMFEEVSTGYIYKGQISSNISSSTTFADILSSLYLYVYESQSNKVTEISSESTNGQYGSAKATYTAIQSAASSAHGEVVAEENRAKAAEKAISDELSAHEANTSNPHSVTKAQIGLGNVDNTSDINKPISTATQTALDGKVDKTTKVNGHALSGNITVTKGDVGLGNVDNKSEATIKSDFTGEIASGNEGFVKGKDVYSHTSNTSNPHGVTKAQVGLGNVDNTSDANKPISTATQAALNAKQDTIDASHKLSSDLVDDTGHTHKFATQAQLTLIDSLQFTDVIVDED